MKDISFFNVTGTSIGVIYRDEFVAHIDEPFPNDPFRFEWNMSNVRKTKFPRDQYPESDIMQFFKAERERVNKETDEKMEQGWTQWVNMDEEDCRMEKLREQLDQFGLTITFARTEGSDFEWFKVEQKYTLLAKK
jgi:hypothetical protein